MSGRGRRERLRIALLDASHGSEHTSRNFRRELDADLTEFDVTCGELPETFAYDGAVVTGSRASVYWDEAWIDDLRAWTRAAADRDLPMLGVCFGHQLLADALGGTVTGMGSYEIGYREIERTAESGLLAGLPERFLAYTTHSDAVVSLPPGAERLAGNDRGLHAFRAGDVFGVQFHPEYDPDTAESVTRGKGADDIDSKRKERALASITEANYRAASEVTTLFENFEAHVRERRADAGSRTSPRAGAVDAERDGHPSAGD